MRQRTPRWLGIGALAATVVLAAACGGSTTETKPLYRGQIAFYSDRDGPFEIYTQGADGSDVRRLTTSGDADDVGTGREQAALWPRWSPDGRRIVFQSGPPQLFMGQIWVMNADGSGKRRLTSPSDGSNVLPAWSPDGAQIAYFGGKDPRLYVMDADGSSRRPLTPQASAALFPVWAPDGTRIAFICAKKREPAICTVSAEGGAVTTVVSPRSNPTLGGFDWSPDGRSFVFMGGPPKTPDVYVVGVDGKGLRKLTDDPAIDGYPAWSPDGRHIIFSSDRSGGTDLYVMNADGTGQTRLIDDAGHDEAPDWARGSID